MTSRIAIRGGSLIDGTGAAARGADVLVEDGTIVAVGAIGAVDALEIDARGCCVAPGFIDIHSHSDFTLLVDPRALSSVHQGVTSEVVGNCGFGCFPIRDRAMSVRSIYGYTSSQPLDWNDAHGYFDRLDAARPAVNVLSLVPNAQLRMSAMQSFARPANGEELAAMKRLLEEGLDAGAWGFSTGLEYPVEESATVRELVELCAAVRSRRALYATHTRGRNENPERGIDEALRTARGADVRLQVSHLLPRTGIDSSRRCMRMIDAAAAAGAAIGFDQHTRLHGFTYLHTALPPWAFDGGRDALRRRLSDPAERARMCTYRGLLGDTWSRVVLLDNNVWPEYSRCDIATMASERGVTPIEAVHDLLLAGIDEFDRLLVIILTYTEDQQREVFCHPLCIPASDATALCPDGPLADSVFHGAYTWAAWYYRFMVRDSRLLSPEEAVHRLTWMPATTIGLNDRGTLATRMQADIAVFDPGVFAERGTTFDPNQLAVGMRHVLVNGVLALRDGASTGERGGRVLRRT